MGNNVDSTCYEGILLPIRRWLELPAEITITESSDGPPGAELPPPFGGRYLRPTTDSWQSPIDRHRGRLRMFLSEGCFFFVLVMILVSLLWRTVRRDIQLEMQHRNFISAITH